MTGLDTKTWTATIPQNSSDTDKTYTIDIKTAFDGRTVHRFTIVQAGGGGEDPGTRQPDAYKVYVNYKFGGSQVLFTVKVLATGSTTYAWELLINVGSIPDRGKMQGRQVSGSGILDYTIQFGDDYTTYIADAASESAFKALWKKDVFSIYHSGNDTPELLNSRATFEFIFGSL